MAKKLSIEAQVGELVLKHLANLEDELAEKFDIDCWDACLNSSEWNIAYAKILNAFTAAVKFDKSWEKV